MKKFPLLRAEDIEVKVKQVTKTGAVALLYKTARVDMAMLDSVVGAENWENDYKEIDGVLFCGIGITEGERTTWKWSNGIESRSDGDGNEKKGEASDAFKRAGFMWGIGRELYTAPFIFLNVEAEEDGKDSKNRPKYKLSDKYASYSVSAIEYDKNNSIASVTIVDNGGSIVYPKRGKKQALPEKKGKSRKDIIKESLDASNLTSEDIKAYMENNNFKSFDTMSADEFECLLNKIEAES